MTAESDENISLNERYEALKLLCSEQVLANELLKEELDRLRKCYSEITRHRAFLLEQVLQLRSKSTENSNHEVKRPVKSSPASKNQNRNRPSQRPVPVDRRPSNPPPRRFQHDYAHFEDSDPESESMSQQGDFDHGWDGDYQNMGSMPSYRRHPPSPTQPRPVKRPQPMPPPKPKIMSPDHMQRPFKRPRVIEPEAGPSSSAPRRPYVDFSPPGSLANKPRMSYDHHHGSGSSNGGGIDISEDPPIILSRGVPASSSSYGRHSLEAPRRSVNQPSILKTSTLASASGNGGLNRLSNDRAASSAHSPMQQNSPAGGGGGGGYLGPRFH